MRSMEAIHDQHIIQAATVIEVHPQHSLVKVSALGKPSGWLPVLQQVNSFKKQFVALRKDEQVVVIAGLFVLRGIYNTGEKEPEGSGEFVDITEYEDGTRIVYDTQKRKLSIDAVGEVYVNAKTVNVLGNQGDVVIDGVSLVHHTHPQNDGNHYGGGVNTNKPSKVS